MRTQSIWQMEEKMVGLGGEHRCFRVFCHACNGSGYDSFDDRQCEFCRGAGDFEHCTEDGS